MDTEFLAKAIGLFALLNGFSMLIRRETVLEAFREMARNQTLTHVIGTVLTIIGAVLVTGHTIFRDFLTVVVTLIGWLLLLDGCVYLLLPNWLVRRYLEPLQRPGPYFAVAIGYLAVASILLFSPIKV